MVDYTWEFYSENHNDPNTKVLEIDWEHPTILEALKTGGYRFGVDFLGTKGFHKKFGTAKKVDRRKKKHTKLGSRRYRIEGTLPNRTEWFLGFKDDEVYHWAYLILGHREKRTNNNLLSFKSPSGYEHHLKLTNIHVLASSNNSSTPSPQSFKRFEMYLIPHIKTDVYPFLYQYCLKHEADLPLLKKIPEFFKVKEEILEDDLI